MPFFRQGQYIGSIAQQRATGSGSGNRVVAASSDRNKATVQSNLAKIKSGQLTRKGNTSNPFKKPVSPTVQSTARRPDTSAVLKSRIIR